MKAKVAGGFNPFNKYCPFLEIGGETTIYLKPPPGKGIRDFARRISGRWEESHRSNRKKTCEWHSIMLIGF